ncbi:hypothetical protein GPALN_004589 [Globodera pallida]|nr:hypothetical protein GPALN_004589 [Globodera pallida]
MIRPNNELQTFLTAYKCSSEDQSQTPPIMYSFDILPNYSSDKIGKLGHSTSEISSISLNTDISAKSKQNFNFLLKLSKIELTPFSILNLAKKLMMSLHLLRAYINIEHPTIYDLVIAHFYREYRPISGLHPVVFWSSDCCNLTNFMLQLMNRVKESPNLSEYFVHAEFSTELEQQLEDNVQKVIKKHQDFLHFAEAVHVNWNPYKELLITLQTFKYVYFCSKEGLDYFRSIANPFDQEQKLLKDLVKEGHETEKDRELMNIIQSNCHRLELDKLMPKLQTLENFKKIQQNYEYLKTFEQLLDERKNEKLAFDSLVILNAELEKAKTFCMEKI